MVTATRRIVYTALYVSICFAVPDVPVAGLRLLVKVIYNFGKGFAGEYGSNAITDVPDKMVQDLKDTPQDLMDLPRKLWENINPFDGKWNP